MAKTFGQAFEDFCKATKIDPRRFYVPEHLASKTYEPSEQPGFDPEEARSLENGDYRYAIEDMLRFAEQVRYDASSSIDRYAIDTFVLCCERYIAL